MTAFRRNSYERYEIARADEQFPGHLYETLGIAECITEDRGGSTP
jgi:uncharacterized protein (DUF952 family)